MNSKTVEGYTSLFDVIREIKDTLILDLTRYTGLLPNSYKKRLRQAPKGIYINGLLEPVLRFDRDYYFSQTAYEAHQKAHYASEPDVGPDITDYDSFIACKERIFNAKGKVIVQVPPIKNKRLYLETCQFEYSAIHVLVLYLHRLIEHLHPSTYCITCIPTHMLDDRSYFLHEDDSIDSTEISHSVKLLTEVDDWIGRDRACFYHLRLKNACVILEKGHDYRVIEYYKPLFEKMEAWNDETGC